MLADQFTEAVATARTMAALDHVARLSWRALAEGHLADGDAEALDLAVQARRARLKGAGLMSVSKPSTARRRPVSPDKRASLERRRRCAMSGAVPAAIAAAFTLAEIAVLSVIAAEVKRRGRCELPIDAIAARAGVCRTVVQNTTREARRLGLIRVTERRRRGQRSDTNIIEIVGLEWRSWLKIGGAGGWVQKREHHEYQFKIRDKELAASQQKTWKSAIEATRALKDKARTRHNKPATDSTIRQAHDGRQATARK